jgi:hypothetical protein
VCQAGYYTCNTQNYTAFWEKRLIIYNCFESLGPVKASCIHKQNCMYICMYVCVCIYIYQQTTYVYTNTNIQVKGNKEVKQSTGD